MCSLLENYPNDQHRIHIALQHASPRVIPRKNKDTRRVWLPLRPPSHAHANPETRPRGSTPRAAQLHPRCYRAWKIQDSRARELSDFPIIPRAARGSDIALWRRELHTYTHAGLIFRRKKKAYAITGRERLKGMLALSDAFGVFGRVLYERERLVFEREGKTIF